MEDYQTRGYMTGMFMFAIVASAGFLSAAIKIGQDDEDNPWASGNRVSSSLDSDEVNAIQLSLIIAGIGTLFYGFFWIGSGNYSRGPGAYKEDASDCANNCGYASGCGGSAYFWVGGLLIGAGINVCIAGARVKELMDFDLPEDIYVGNDTYVEKYNFDGNYTYVGNDTYVDDTWKEYGDKYIAAGSSFIVAGAIMVLAGIFLIVYMCLFENAKGCTGMNAGYSIISMGIWMAGINMIVAGAMYVKLGIYEQDWAACLEEGIIGNGCPPDEVEWDNKENQYYLMFGGALCLLIGGFQRVATFDGMGSALVDSSAYDGMGVQGL